MADPAERPRLTFAVVSTAKRDLLARCLAALGRERQTLPFPSETVVVDNASGDGSRELCEGHPAVDRLIALPHRSGKAACDTLLLQEAAAEYVLLLNEDAELQPGAPAALLRALEADRAAAAAGAQLLDPDGRPTPCAWRFPTPFTAFLGALGLARLFVVQSKGSRVREVGWCQSSALLVRKSAAAAVGYLDPRFFVYSDEVDFQKRLQAAGHRILYVPAAAAIHHEQLREAVDPRPRIVELCRNRDLYMRLHHGPLAALLVRVLSAFGYTLRALLAVLLPGRSARRYLLYAWSSLFPGRGEGLRERAHRFNETVSQDRSSTSFG